MKNAAYLIDSLTFSPDGSTLALEAAGNKVKLLDVETHKLTTLLDLWSEYAAPRVVFSRDGKILASGSACIAKIRLFDVATGKPVAVLEGNDEWGVKALAFTPDGKVVSLHGTQRGAPAVGRSFRQAKVGAGIVEWTPAAAFSRDEKMLATALDVVENINGKNVTTDNSVRLWEVASGKELAALHGHVGDISCWHSVSTARRLPREVTTTQSDFGTFPPATRCHSQRTHRQNPGSGIQFRRQAPRLRERRQDHQGLGPGQNEVRRAPMPGASRMLCRL